jgi:predicted ATPase/transcriptional regulator with XRE-family HTH domain
MINTSISFGAWLKQRRKSLDLTQAELAHRISCTTSLLQKIESGERRPSCQIAELLATALDIAPDKQRAFVDFARADQSASVRVPFLSPANLPAPVTPLIGRAHEVDAVRTRLMQDSTRLVTLVGPPGIGKTRLSLAVAADVRDCFDDGVFFVALAPVNDPDLVAPAVAQVLGLKETTRQAPLDQLIDYLRDKLILLVLDNFEQIIDAAPDVARLLSACPIVKLLVTSRIALRIRAERQFHVLPLALPDLKRLPSIGQLLLTPAIALFVDRAEAVNPNFALTNLNALAVAMICHRLNGLPLAIELIAARTALMSPPGLLERLHGDVLLRSDGLCDSDPRQRTLFNAIDWSYHSLTHDEQMLLAQLGTFVGGWTLAAAEAIGGHAVLNDLTSLVNKSLVVRNEQAGEVRFTLLEMIREYALEQLRATGEADAARRRHADYYLSLVEAAEPQLIRADQKHWLDRLERDHDNLRAAFDWLLDRAELGKAARVCTALRHFWVIRGHLSEGRRSVERLLSNSNALTGLTASQTVRLLNAAGCLAYNQGDYAAAHSFFEDALARARSSGERYEEAFALDGLGAGAANQDDRTRALELAHESLALSQAIGDRWLSAVTLITLGELARLTSDYDDARQLYEQSLALLRQIGDKWFIAMVLNNLGQVAQYQGRLAQAQAIQVESLSLCEEVGNYRGAAFCLENFAGVAGLLGQCERAARLLGAAQALRAVTHTVMETGTLDCLDHDRAVNIARAGLNEAAFQAAWTAGRAMTPEEAIAYALEQTAASLPKMSVLPQTAGE